MSDRFYDAVVQIRAEQFFEEKAASARGGLSPAEYASFVKSASEEARKAKQPTMHFVMDRWISSDTKDPYELALMNHVRKAYASGKAVGVKPGEKPAFDK